MTRRLVTVATVAGVITIGACSGPATAAHDVPRLAERPVPCQKHTRHTRPTRAACLGRWRTRVAAQNRRDRAAWPARPVTVRDLRVRHVPVARFVRLARCEAGLGSEYGGARWTTPAGWTYQGGLGIWYGNGPAVGSPYGDLGRIEWQAQMLVGHRVMLRWGASAWEAYRKHPGACWWG